MEQKKEDNGEAIASSMMKLASLKVPVIAIVIGEASSGGALAIGVASILWKDSSRAKEAAEKMKITAKDLYDLKVIDKIIKEPDDFEKLANNIKKEIKSSVTELKELSGKKLVEDRYKKFRKMGEYIRR